MPTNPNHVTGYFEELGTRKLCSLWDGDPIDYGTLWTVIQLLHRNWQDFNGAYQEITELRDKLADQMSKELKEVK